MDITGIVERKLTLGDEVGEITETCKRSFQIYVA